MTKEKEPEKSTTPSMFRTRKRDGVEMQKKGYWIPAERALAFEMWCTANRRDESEVLSELIGELLRRKR